MNHFHYYICNTHTHTHTHTRTHKSLRANMYIFLVVKRPVNTGILVSEYRGTVVQREALYKDMQGDPSLRYLCRSPSPFILLPPSPPISTPTLAFGVDARNSGSPARFVRRSCSPNADVRVLWDKEKPRFAVS